MSSQTFKLPTRDGLDLFAQTWAPATSPRATVTLVHGIGEHCARYQHVAEFFNQHGIAVLAFDLRGHGNSPGKRGAIPGYEQMLDDVAAALAATEKAFPGQPNFIYGHSMGGNLVVNYVLRRRPSLAGMLATSPWLKLSEAPPAGQMKLVQLLSRVAPNFSQTNSLDLQGLARDPQVIQDYQNDPLVHNRITVRLAAEFFEAADWALAHAADLAIPALLVHGSADRLTSPLGSQEFAARAGDLCTLKIWDGYFHETHNEPEKEQVLAYNLAWIEAQLT